ncbi:GNAT family acetyltransferase [Chryseobacterium sp. P1-3]|uniref:GNAT family N-acetyltransferase n=1 Tax=Chryseobacterium gallinarum TaxID=1324352 RepID=A0A0G3M9P2_CHRGL|nr:MULTISPECIES: GNAT family protein [Chryseobacterium]AKK74648.1 GNAT family acetyltransferase [Chryseobacterium gallinarum]KFF75724.1 GNAT family acetyltransferase [Chryseobacterium sp. P1-3]MCL8538491.1 GNAT family N-acetyltransferase [Chryseobacterium gallinarum]QIY89549.1 GNAT family N-acetyltransferase [Chryseobacterium gallinarum]
MIELQLFTIDDSSELISKIKNERMLLQFAGPAYHFPLTEKQLEEDLANENRTLFKIVDGTGGNTIGHAQIFLKEETFLLGRILIWDENNRGKGYGKKVMQQLLRYGFGHFDKETAELNVYDWNTGAIECYKKVGFTIDPAVRNEAQIDQETWISLNMKIHRKTFELQ